MVWERGMIPRSHTTAMVWERGIIPRSHTMAEGLAPEVLCAAAGRRLGPATCSLPRLILTVPLSRNGTVPRREM